MSTRIRSIIDDRHNIRNPFGPQNDLEIWANTLLKTRIPTLFRTIRGLKGHVEQLQNEINRLGKGDCLSPALKNRAIAAGKLLRCALIKAKKAGEESGFPLHRRNEDCFPHLE